MEDEERRQINFVVDKPAEIGIKVQNVLTALVLGVMGWVGMNIESIKTNVSDIKIETKINTKEIAYLKDKDKEFDAKINKILMLIDGHISEGRK